MIKKILIAFAIVILCFWFPSMVASEHLVILDLLQDGIMSASVVALMLYAVKGWTAILICIIEGFLIAVAIMYGIRFESRHSFYFAINYTPLHDAAFALELAIITIRTITGYRQIGADYSRFIADHTAPFFDRRHRERN